jgi:hypothetical protein
VKITYCAEFVVGFFNECAQAWRLPRAKFSSFSDEAALGRRVGAGRAAAASEIAIEMNWSKEQAGA